MRAYIVRPWLLALVVLAIAGCSTPSKPPVVSTDATDLIARQAARDALLGDLEGWQFSGRVKVEGNERPTSAEIQWIKRGENSRVTLSGPGGFRASTVQVSPGAVVLRRPDGQVLRADNPDQLIEKLVGWPMPLSLMNDWVLGLPGPANVLSRDAKAQLEGAQYREWTGKMDRYKSVDTVSMPHRIAVTDGHLRVRISVREWDIGPPSAATSQRIPVPGVGG
ncbi:MAG: lipoprotein insertase outer membrane protein LolB [Pseudomonadota bacterium]